MVRRLFKYIKLIVLEVSKTETMFDILLPPKTNQCQFSPRRMTILRLTHKLYASMGLYVAAVSLLEGSSLCLTSLELAMELESL